jgi:hypothetical protein
MNRDEAQKYEAELNVELDAMQDYFERTGKSMHILGSVEQRKILEAWREDHEENKTQ